MSLEQRLKEQALAQGFELAGIAPAGPADGFERLQEWLARGFAGTMDYMERHEEARRHPAGVLPTVRTVLMAAMNYAPAREPSTSDREELAAPHNLTGKIARYARGDDYHDILRCKFKQLLAWIQREVPGTEGRAVVDTAPLLERDFARRAGLGWFGKNTMLIHKKLGSYFLLGALLLDLELESDTPFAANHCGTCTACLDACPTQAFPAPGMLDARLCISYLTIELRGAIPTELRSPMGDWVFGCDICQEVCPWNRKAPPGREPALQGRPDLEALDLVEVMGLSEEAFRRRFKGTALYRSKRRGLLRNAAIVLGNQGDPAALPALEKALADSEPLVRDAAAWAISRIRMHSQLSAHTISDSER
jgi:epoxyqueuosine reductase